MTIRVPSLPASEWLFSFQTADHRRVDCELLSRGEHGWEARFYIDGQFSRSGRFLARANTLAWADGERRAFERTDEIVRDVHAMTSAMVRTMPESPQPARARGRRQRD
jgi:hypothetical protein